MARVLVTVPSYDGMVKSLTAETLCNIEWGCDELDYRFVSGYGIAHARNLMAELAVGGGYDFIFMVDSDMVVPPDALVNLREDDVNVALGYAVRGSSDDGLTSVIKLGYEGYRESYYAKEIAAVPEHTIAVKGGGLACALIRTDVFRRIGKPWFVFSEQRGEDYAFCKKCSDVGIAIYVDTRVGCGHIHDRVLEAR